jgi:hypothetical protein
MKRDSQAHELADQWTPLRGERELSANKSGTTRLRSASQVLPVRGALSTSRVKKYPERLCQTGDLTLPLVTRMFLQGQFRCLLILCSQATLADSFRERMRGLLGRSQLGAYEGMLF